MFRPQTLRAVILAALIAVLALPAAASAAGSPPRDLSVISYNIHHGVGEDGVLDLGRIADVIAQSGADVVALQEVDNHWSARSEFADQAAELAGMLDMHYVYGANLDRDPAEPGQERRQYGTAILSRFPILDSENISLPNLGGEQRGLLEATINVRGRKVLVYSTHLQHDNPVERAAQVEAIIDHVGFATMPVVLAGDLNATPDAPEMQPLRYALTDTFEVAGSGQGDTFPAADPDRRIDYVLVNDHVAVSAADVVPSLASDHLAVRAQITLTAPYAPVTSLDRAHAHNDYEHRRPLFDALHHGFTSVEADIWLVDGELRVAHDLDQTVAGRTIEALYLDPLQAITRANNGQVYPDRNEPVQLLVDIKSDAEATYTQLTKTLASYRQMLTQFGPAGTREGAVEVVISGNRPRELMESEPVRWAAYDGRLTDLDGDAPASFIPLLSDRWTTTFTWRGVGPMLPTEEQRLQAIVTTAHQDDRRVRFWATPDEPGPARENIWHKLVEVDVDHINTDDLAGLQAFLLANDQ